MTDLIQKAKARNDIFSVFDALGYETGNNHTLRTIQCPKHEDRNPSLTIRRKTQRFTCYSCGWRGDVLEIVQYTRRLDSAYEAAEYLLNTDLPTKPAPAVETNTLLPDRGALTEAMRFYHMQLMRTGTQPQLYLANRSLTRSAVVSNAIGYCSGFSTGFFTHMQKKGFAIEQIESTGLLYHHRSETDLPAHYRERMIRRILIPDIENFEVTWIVGRKIDQDNDYPKYMAISGPPPDAFGAGRLDPKSEFVIMCEGIIDYLLVKSWGYPAVAAMGTDGIGKAIEAVSHIPLIIPAFDNDEAGRRATFEVSESLPHRVAPFPIPASMNDVADFGSNPALTEQRRIQFKIILDQILKQGVPS